MDILGLTTVSSKMGNAYYVIKKVTFIITPRNECNKSHGGPLCGEVQNFIRDILKDLNKEWHIVHS